MKAILHFSLVASVLICGCNKQSANPETTPKGFIAPETDRFALLEQKLGDLEQRVSTLEFDKTLNEWSRTNNFVSLSLDEKGYTPIQTTIGQLLIAGGSATPYLDGFKVDFQIGNPQSVTYDGITVTLQWGPSVTRSISTNKMALIAWRNAQKTKTDKMLSKLLPGYWNNVEVIVTPATTEELRNLEVSVETGTLSLGTKTSSAQ